MKLMEEMVFRKYFVTSLLFFSLLLMIGLFVCFTVCWRRAMYSTNFKMHILIWHIKLTIVNFLKDWARGTSQEVVSDSVKIFGYVTSGNNYMHKRQGAESTWLNPYFSAFESLAFPALGNSYLKRPCCRA